MKHAIGASAALVLAGCAGNDAKLEIRPSSAPSAQVAMPVEERLADGRAQLALGNVALALELFRKAEREAPGTLAALVGIAECYDRMGRHELSSRYIEQALAREPRNANLLRLLAMSFTSQGRYQEAEAARLQAQASNAPVPAKTVTVALPQLPAQASNAPVAAKTVTVALPSPRALDAPEKIERSKVALPEAAHSVTMTLPPPTPIQPAVEASAELRPEPVVPPRVRLERVSRGEIALVTSGRSLWTRLAEVRPPVGRTTRNGTAVRLLNAARFQGLAASARRSLQRQGWADVAIGDAAKVRQHSLVLYSAHNRQMARRLAAQLGFALARQPRPGRVTVLLGRDAVHAVRAKRT